MKNKYVLGKFVEADLDHIWEYIARDNIEAADSLIAKLFAAFQDLANMPGKGHSREDHTPLPVLFWPVSSYLVLYRIESVQVEIIAVTHGARDIPIFLGQRTMGKQ